MCCRCMSFNKPHTTNNKPCRAVSSVAEHSVDNGEVEGSNPSRRTGLRMHW